MAIRRKLRASHIRQKGHLKLLKSIVAVLSDRGDRRSRGFSKREGRRNGRCRDALQHDLDTDYALL